MRPVSLLCVAQATSSRVCCGKLLAPQPPSGGYTPPCRQAGGSTLPCRQAGKSRGANQTPLFTPNRTDLIGMSSGQSTISFSQGNCASDSRSFLPRWMPCMAISNRHWMSLLKKSQPFCFLPADIATSELQWAFSHPLTNGAGTQTGRLRACHLQRKL